jgi:hypothetical protein
MAMRTYANRHTNMKSIAVFALTTTVAMTTITGHARPVTDLNCFISAWELTREMPLAINHDDKTVNKALAQISQDVIMWQTDTGASIVKWVLNRQSGFISGSSLNAPNFISGQCVLVKM